MTNQPTPLPVSLFDIIAWVETKNNPHAMRFEPAMYQHVTTGGAVDSGALARIKALHNCSDGTAHAIYSSSYGAVQIMGFNLYADPMLFAGDVVQFMGDPIAQAAAFDGFCQKKNLPFTVADIALDAAKRAQFARIYNGSESAYTPLIVDALKHFRIGVTE